MIPLRSSERIYSPTPVVIGLIAANFMRDPSWAHWPLPSSSPPHGRRSPA